jgi:outer membrane protein
MFRNPRNWMLIGLVAALLWSLGAEDQGIKIGVVDIEQALAATNDGKKAREELERKGREAEAQLEPMVQRYKALQGELKEQKYALSEDAKREKLAQLAELENKIGSKQQELKGQLEIDKQRVFGPLLNKLGTTLTALGKDQGFTIIVRKEMLLYGRESLDITDLVVSRFNAAK